MLLASERARSRMLKVSPREPFFRTTTTPFFVCYSTSTYDHPEGITRFGDTAIVVVIRIIHAD